MCGRFTFEHEWPAFVGLYDLPWDEERGRNTAARYNIVPTRCNQRQGSLLGADRGSRYQAD
jgi:putative SOS response-associated peptidase YedK